MQPLYRQWLHGDREYDAWLLDQRRTLANDAPLVSGHSMTGEGVYSDETGPGLDIYYKGSLLLHSLRALIGDEAFFRATRELVYGRADPGPGNFEPRYGDTADRSEEHTSELQSLMRISYAVFCLKQKNNKKRTSHNN